MCLVRPECQGVQPVTYVVVAPRDEATNGIKPSGGGFQVLAT